MFKSGLLKNQEPGKGRGKIVGADEEEKTEYPFVPPELDKSFPNLNGGYYPEYVNDAVLISPGVQATPSARNKVLVPGVPIVYFKWKVYQEIMYIVKTMTPKTGECGGFALLERMNPHAPQFMVYDYFVPGQKAVSVEVDLDGEDSTKYFNYLSEKWPEKFGDDKHRQIMHWHSHGNMGAFFSATDDKQQSNIDQLGYQDDYRIYIVFTAKGTFKVNFVYYSPVFAIAKDTPVGVILDDDMETMELSAERKAELDKLMEDHIEERSSSYAGRSYYDHFNWRNNRRGHYGVTAENKGKGKGKNKNKNKNKNSWKNKCKNKHSWKGNNMHKTEEDYKATRTATPTEKDCLQAENVREIRDLVNDVEEEHTAEQELIHYTDENFSEEETSFSIPGPGEYEVVARRTTVLVCSMLEHMCDSFAVSVSIAQVADSIFQEPAAILSTIAHFPKEDHGDFTNSVVALAIYGVQEGHLTERADTEYFVLCTDMVEQLVKTLIDHAYSTVAECAVDYELPPLETLILDRLGEYIFAEAVDGNTDIPEILRLVEITESEISLDDVLSNMFD